MFIIPIGHDSMRVGKLPFATMAIIALCLAVHFPVQSKMADDLEQEAQTAQRAVHLYMRHHYLPLPTTAVDLLEPQDRTLYEKERVWASWYDESPEEVEKWVATRANTKSRGRGQGISSLLRDMQAMTGTQNNAAFEKEAGLSWEPQKIDFLTALVEEDADDYSDRHDEMNQIAEQLDSVRRGSLLLRLGVVPARMTIWSLVTHQFLHGGIFHLLFNMLFLWLAAVKLEDIWPRWFFVCTYLALGVIAALVHSWSHPTSNIPMIGASGAVAGLMGIFMVRFARVNINFFYVYWAFSIKPRKGTFESPAYVMLPFWFFGELFSALFLDFGPVAYWSHVGGFLAGTAVGLALHFSSFEEDVLGIIVDLSTPATPKKTELVAFQIPPGATVASLETGFALPRLDLDELQLSAINPEGLVGTTGKSAGETLTVSPEELAYIAVGRIDQFTDADAALLFSFSLPHAPAWILTLVGKLQTAGGISFAKGYVLDGAKIKYGQLFDQQIAASHQNISALARAIMSSCPGIQYVHGPGPMGPHNLPIYVDLDQFMTHIPRSIRALSQNAQP